MEPCGRGKIPIKPNNLLNIVVPCSCDETSAKRGVGVHEVYAPSFHIKAPGRSVFPVFNYGPGPKETSLAVTRMSLERQVRAKVRMFNDERVHRMVENCVVVAVLRSPPSATPNRTRRPKNGSRPFWGKNFHQVSCTRMLLEMG